MFDLNNVSSVEDNRHWLLRLLLLSRRITWLRHSRSLLVNRREILFLHRLGQIFLVAHVLDETEHRNVLAVLDFIGDSANKTSPAL